MGAEMRLVGRPALCQGGAVIDTLATRRRGAIMPGDRHPVGISRANLLRLSPACTGSGAARDSGERRAGVRSLQLHRIAVRQDASRIGRGNVESHVRIARTRLGYWYRSRPVTGRPDQKIEEARVYNPRMVDCVGSLGRNSLDYLVGSPDIQRRAGP